MPISCNRGCQKKKRRNTLHGSINIESKESRFPAAMTSPSFSMFLLYVLKLHVATPSHIDSFDTQFCHQEDGDLSLKTTKGNSILPLGTKDNSVSITTGEYANPKEPITIRVVSCSTSERKPYHYLRAFSFEAQTWTVPRSKSKGDREYGRWTRIICGFRNTAEVCVVSNLAVKYVELTNRIMTPRMHMLSLKI